jgi:prepilin-type N-terminal cleavage/methylation domain-containing protein
MAILELRMKMREQGGVVAGRGVAPGFTLIELLARHPQRRAGVGPARREVQSGFTLIELLARHPQRREGVGPARREVQSGFTLIELLVVIGIMAVMLALAMPAFTGLGRGTSMQTAVAELRTTLALARQYAITHRVYTFVVFPDGDPSLYSGAPGEVVKAFKAYGVCYDDGTAKRCIGEWKFLPPGIVFDNVTLPIASSSGLPSATLNLFTYQNFNVIPNVEFPQWGTYRDLIGMGFRPDGSTAYWSSLTQRYVFSTTDPAILLSEGSPDNVNTNTGTVADEPFIQPNGQTFGIQLFTRTGQFRVREY